MVVFINVSIMCYLSWRKEERLNREKSYGIYFMPVGFVTHNKAIHYFNLKLSSLRIHTDKLVHRLVTVVSSTD